MKTNKKRLIACVAISLLASVQPAVAGHEVEKPETTVRPVESMMFHVRNKKNKFKFPKKLKPSFKNARRY